MTEQPKIIMGRPDFADKEFGKTYAKRFPPYVYGKVGHARLVHKVARLVMRWYDIGMIERPGDCLVRRDSPKISYETVCGMNFFADYLYPTQRKRYGTRPRSTLCTIPAPDAVLCGRCQGELPAFSKKNKKTTVTQEQAKLRIGCIASGTEEEK